MKLFCAIVGVAGGGFFVRLGESDSVDDLKKAIKAEKPDTIKGDADNLQLFLAKKDKKDRQWLVTEKDVVESGVSDTTGMKLLKVARARLRLVGLSEKDVGGVDEEEEAVGNGPVNVLVVIKEGASPMAAPALFYSAPTLKMLSWDSIDPMTNTPYRVDTNEFTLSDYEVHSLIPTANLNHFFHSYGWFPATYFVREEEKKLWDIMLARLDQTEDDSAHSNERTEEFESTVIVGSPGVGKSVFLMMLGFYVSLVWNQRVLVYRKLKAKGFVYLYIDSSSFSRGRAGLEQFESIREQFAGAWVFLDGFNHLDVNGATHFAALRPFRVLATSCQYDVKDDDPVDTVVLPAWRVNDLEVYAQLTDWVKDVKLRQRKHKKAIPMLVKLQYFYSGGSMREFCRNHAKCMKRCRRIVGLVPPSQQCLLITNFGQESTEQVDRIRRHYIADTSNLEHYQDTAYWQTSVDSGWMMRWLQANREVGQVYEFYQYAKAVGGGFYGTAFEVLFHHTAQHYHQTRKIVLRTNDSSDYTSVEFEIDHVTCSGNGLKACHNLLKSLPDGTYWYPDYGYLPFIDCVCRCRLVERSGREVETLAFIQVTVAKIKVFRPHRMAELEQLQRSNPHLCRYEPIYLVVTPSQASCDAFELVQQDDRIATELIDYDLSDFEDECPEEADEARDEREHSVQWHGDASPGDNAMEIDPAERQSREAAPSWKQIITYLDPESIYVHKTDAHLVVKDTEDPSQKKRKQI